jgi:hypothetical protein
MFLNVFNRVTHALNLLGVFVGNLDVEFFLEPHYQLNRIERVGTKIVDEPRVGS